MRPNQDEYFLKMAKLVGSRSNCYRRHVGCVLVDSNNLVLSTGYNGVPSGFPHCKIGECPRMERGKDLHICVAIHAEQNALMQCADIYKIKKAYITESPCLTCTVMLLNTSCEEIIFEKFYPGSEKSERACIDSNRKWTQIRHTNSDVSG